VASFIYGFLLGFLISYLIQPKQSDSRAVIQYREEQLKKEILVKDSIIQVEREVNRLRADSVKRIQAERDTARLEREILNKRVNDLTYRYETIKKYDFTGVSLDSIARAFAAELSH
jgi:hypothetical protein